MTSEKDMNIIERPNFEEYTRNKRRSGIFTQKIRTPLAFSWCMCGERTMIGKRKKS